jgi:hypothetical protein
MSYFPRAARVLVVLALSAAVAAVPSTAVAAEKKPSAHRARHHAPHLTRHQLRVKRAHERAHQRAKARAERVARVKAARAHARRAVRNKRLRTNMSLPHQASIVFDKNWKNPFDSRIVFHVWVKPHPRKQPKRWVEVEKVSWRAGSGLSGAAGRDECHRGQGWSPNGTYSFVQHDRRKAPLINGRVFELQPMACRNGTVRQLMFIHSEQTWDNKQCKNVKGDDGCRWEVPRVNDYKSWGCIKMAPGDLKALTRHFHRYFKAETRYPTNMVRVKVKD